MNATQDIDKTNFKMLGLWSSHFFHRSNLPLYHWFSSQKQSKTS